jgi:hypothetical protein
MKTAHAGAHALFEKAGKDKKPVRRVRGYRRGDLGFCHDMDVRRPRNHVQLSKEKSFNEVSELRLLKCHVAHGPDIARAALRRCGGCVTTKRIHRRR